MSGVSSNGVSNFVYTTDGINFNGVSTGSGVSAEGVTAIGAVSNTTTFMLMETNDAILLETGSKILLES